MIGSETSQNPPRYPESGARTHPVEPKKRYGNPDPALRAPQSEASGLSGTMELVRSLVTDLRTWFRQETELAKTELSEKASQAGKNAAAIAAGALTAYAGVIVFLFAVAGAIGAGFLAAGIPPMVASFLGSMLVAGVVMLAGAIMIKKGKEKLSPEELKPGNTAESLRQAKDLAAHNTKYPTS